MNRIVADTHAAIWYLAQSPRLSTTARRAMQESMASGSRVLLSAISIVEMIYLVEKNRLDATALRELQAVIADPEGGFWIAPMDYRICRFVEQIPREAVPDMPDRIIAATALALEMPLVTCDESIRSSPVTTIW